MDYEKWKRYIIDVAMENPADFFHKQFCAQGAFESATVSDEALKDNPAIMIITIGEHIGLSVYTWECFEDYYRQEGRFVLSSAYSDLQWTLCWDYAGDSRGASGKISGDVEAAAREHAEQEWENLVADYVNDEDGTEKHIWFFPRGLFDTIDGVGEVPYASNKQQ